MSASIFISRRLEPTSPIIDIVRQRRLKITDRSLLTFEAVDFEAPDTKWLFFYSKTGVKYFSNYCSLSHYQIGCYGPATATYCMKFHDVRFQCDASIKSGIIKVEELVGAETLTFVVGKQSLRSLQKVLPPHVHQQEVIVYDQSKKQINSLGAYDIAILTSPMNVESFFENEGKASRYIAIGDTTAATLRNHQVKPIVSIRPSEDGMAETLDSALKTYF